MGIGPGSWRDAGDSHRDLVFRRGSGEDFRWMGFPMGIIDRARELKLRGSVNCRADAMWYGGFQPNL